MMPDPHVGYNPGYMPSYATPPPPGGPSPPPPSR